MQTNPTAIPARSSSTWLLGLLIGILGVLVSFVPGAQKWQEDVGLGLLFELRGQRPPPRDVMILTLDGHSGQRPEIDFEPDEWPRSRHAVLIDRLVDAGVALIVFDIFFRATRDPKTNQQLADAMRRAENVLLVGYLEQRRIPTGKETLEIERLIPPTAALAEAAVDIAPFVLPKVPVKVSRFWLFHGNHEHDSLPVAALHHLADPDGETLRRLLPAVGHDAKLPINDPEDRKIRHLLRTDAGLRKRLRERANREMPELSPGQRQRLIALLRLYDSDNHPLLNFYGPPGSIKTLPVQRILDHPSPLQNDFRDKVVFVGYAGDYQPLQKDGFYTVFSQSDGLDLSGVEIAATAFANLLWTETVSPLGPGGSLALLLAYGVLVVLLFRSLSGISGVLVGITLAGLYFCLVYVLFARDHLWVPWLVPLAVQTPLALILSLIWHYRQLQHSRTRVKELFGYYLPGDVVERLVASDRHQVAEIDSAFGVCLASDAQDYTRLAETLEPQALQVFLNRYYEIVFSPVRARGGVVSDVVGDAMLAIWPATRPDPALQQKACEAALEIVRAIQVSDLEPRLHTRIGLHAGELVMSHIGAIDHFEYRAVGDMVNTTARIENLNKRLGTSILASRDFVAGLRGVLIRELGEFSLPGKQRPITVYEVAASSRTATVRLKALHEDFAEALYEWRLGKRDAAYEKFSAIRREHPHDGPTAYYLRLYREHNRDAEDPLG